MALDRRVLLGFGLTFGLSAPAAQAAKNASEGTAYAFSFDMAEGPPLALDDQAGRPMLIVNTASKCGFATQLTSLETLWNEYGSRGLLVLGVPSGDFGDQELANGENIKQFCALRFGVSFPLAAKTHVAGPNAHPFYRWAARQRPGQTPSWNFHKYLIGRDGQIAAVFPTSVDPLDKRVVAALEAILSSSPVGQ